MIKRLIYEYNEVKEIAIYSYNFGRFDSWVKQIENISSGYSKSFLELLGINEDLLSFLILRGQKICLIKDYDNN